MLRRTSYFLCLAVIVGLLGSANTVRADAVLDYSAATGVTTDGSGNVTQWNDTAGVADNATGATGPLLTTASINGFTKPVLRFDGTDVLGATTTVPSAGTVFLVFNNTDGGGAERRLIGWDDSSAGSEGVGISDNLNGAIIRHPSNPSSDMLFLEAGPGAAFEIWGVSWGAGGGNLYKDRAGDVTLYTNASTGGSDGTLPLQIGGPGSGASGKWIGDLAALQAHDTQLSNPDMLTQMGVLRNTWFVPEPSALVLLSMGLVGLVCSAWRKRR